MTKTGSPSILKLRELPSRQIHPNELRIKLEFAGVNYADILSRKGLYSWSPKRPYVLGLEGYGQIIEKGKRVANKWQIDDSVIIGTQSGCYSTEVIVKEKNLFPSLNHFTPQENAAFLVNFATAYAALVVIGNINGLSKPNVLINSAAGGVGSAAVLLAKVLGANVIGTASKDEKLAVIQKLGADLAINYHSQGINDKSIRNKKIDFCLESVGGKIFKDSFNILAPLGSLVSIGMSNIHFSKKNPFTWISAYRTIPRINVLKLLGTNRTVSGLHLGRLLDNNKVENFREDLYQIVTKNRIKPLIGKNFLLKDVNNAHEWIESRQSIGKILLDCTT
ncbi:MAG: zinc-binding dehydrogenase [Candidatus Hodarchaeales archaeon]